MAKANKASVTVEVNGSAFELDEAAFKALASNFAEQVKNKLLGAYEQSKDAIPDSDKGHVGIDIDW